MKKITTSLIIKVQFFRPMNGATEFYFGSLAAIYEVFTPEQIGCKLKTLWDNKIDFCKPKANKLCIISKHIVHRKKQEQ